MEIQVVISLTTIYSAGFRYVRWLAAGFVHAPPEGDGWRRHSKPVRNSSPADYTPLSSLSPLCEQSQLYVTGLDLSPLASWPFQYLKLKENLKL